MRLRSESSRHPRRARCAPSAGAALLALAIATTPSATRAQPGAATVTVSAKPTGPSTRYIGAGYGYDAAGFAEAGFNAVFFGDSIETWEPVNDTAAYGALSPEAIKRDPNLVPWAVWDGTLGGAKWRPIWDATKARGVRVTIGLRNQYRKTNWSANPPKTQADLDEWWEHCFALAYWLNVRNDYRVDDFQLLNEPDLAGIKPPGEGWLGTEADYLKLVPVTRDALDFVYKTYLPGRQPTLLAPAVSFPAAMTPPAPDGVAMGLEGYWVKDVLKHAGPAVDAIAYHHYASASSLLSNIKAPLKTWAQSAGRPQIPIWLTEWGGKKATIPDGVDAIRQLIAMSRPGSYVTGSHYFYWGSLTSGGARTTIFHALRIATAALQGGKPGLETAASGDGIEAFATKNEDGALNLLVANTGAGAATIAIDVRAALPRVGRARLFRYDAAHAAAEEVAAPFTAPEGRVELPAPGVALLQLYEGAGPPIDAGAAPGRDAGADAEPARDAAGGAEPARDAAVTRRDAAASRPDAGSASPLDAGDEPSATRVEGGCACAVGAAHRSQDGVGVLTGVLTVFLAVGVARLARRGAGRAARRRPSTPPFR